MRTQPAAYNSKNTQQFADFSAQLSEAAKSNGGTFDSAAATEFLSGGTNQNTIAVPEILQATLDGMPKDKSQSVLKAILDGANQYAAHHGVYPTADVIESAVHQGYATTDEAKKRYHLLDSATSAHSDPLSLQPNRAVIAIMAAMAEAIPVANYLPTDIGSNEAKLIIVSHTAGNNYGGYVVDQNMDGVASGDPYTSSQRVDILTLATGTYTGTLTAIQLTPSTCDHAATAAKLMKGRTNIYVAGYLAGTEVNSTFAGSSSNVSGSVVLPGSSQVYSVSGTVNVDSGALAITVTPALPANTPVIAEGFIDYERSPGTIPLINTSATAFKLFASPWKVNTEQSIDSRTQFANELGLDPSAESMLAVRNQAANERHYDVLRKAARLGANYAATYDFNFSNRSQQLVRAQIWLDFAAVLGALSQQMAVNTIDHGITHLYVSQNVMANMLSLPREIFEPSGVANRPGIYRVGRLFGLYEVYYTPKVAVDTSPSASTIICIGRSTQVARNPFVLGDAVPPTINPLPYTRDQVAGTMYYARCFTSVNPHQPSAAGCAIINVINLA